MTIDVRSFGAAGDAMADDTDAFVAAAQAALALNQPVVYLPDGHYRATVESPPQVSWVGQRQAVIWEAAAPDAFALSYLFDGTFAEALWRRPYVEGVGFTGVDRTRGGVHIENKGGVDLLDVACWRCSAAVRVADAYYGTYDRLLVTDCAIGVHLAYVEGVHNAANKRLINPEFKSCGVGLWAGEDFRRVTLLGGSFEGCRLAVLVDNPRVWATGEINALNIKHAWFEANANLAKGEPVVTADGAPAPDGDVYVHKGALRLENVDLTSTAVGENGELYLYDSEVGTLTVAPSATVVSV